MSTPPATRVTLAILLSFALQCRPILPRSATLEREPTIGASDKAFPTIDIDTAHRYARLNECIEPTKDACKGAPLRPGDVLYLRRWWPSTNARNGNDHHWTGPLSVSERIPLRYVDTATGMLYPQERELLGTILTTQRSVEFNRSSSTPALIKVLETHERELWNALIAGMKIKRVSDGEQNLLLTVPMKALCDTLPAGFGSYFQCNASEPVETEVVGISLPYGSPWRALVGSPSEFSIFGNEDYYAFEHGTTNPGDLRKAAPPPCSTGGDAQPPSSDPAIQALIKRQQVLEQQVAFLSTPQGPDSPALGRPWSTYNFVDVELNGIDMRDPGDSERRWTLQDWEQSQVCYTRDGFPAERIAELMFRGSVLQFQIVADKDSATDFVDVRSEPSNRFSRRISRISEACTACTNIKKIERSSLRAIYPRDVKSILWSYKDAGGKTRYTKIPHCSPRN